MTGGRMNFYPPEEQPDPLLCWLWLARTLGYASPCAGRVLETFGDAQTAWEERAGPEFRRAAGAAATQRANQPGNTPESCRSLALRCRAAGVKILTYADEDYPLALIRTPDLPPVLYCTGDTAYLNAPGAVGVVGSRRPDGYGIQAAGTFSRALAQQGAVIVSGLADGLDSEAHRAAVEASAPTIGVLGVSIDRTYPASNRLLRRKIEDCGCVISEYGPGEVVQPRAGFLQRNRLIAGLSKALLVIQAREKSGTMSTVGHAERYGRPIFALPGNVFSDYCTGTNGLIQSGRAKLALRPGDLFETLGLSDRPAAAVAPAQPRKELSDRERRVLGCMGAEPASVEELAARSGLPTAALLSALMTLQLGGRVRALPGQRYILR